MGSSLRSALPRAVGDSLREVFASGVLPAFERATQVRVRERGRRGEQGEGS